LFTKSSTEIDYRDAKSKGIRPLEAVAVAISLMAAVFTGLQWKEARETRFLATKSSLDFYVYAEYEHTPLGVGIVNYGPAVATITSIEFFVGGKPVRDTAEALESAGFDSDKNWGVSVDKGGSIGVGETKWLVDYHTKNAMEAMKASVFVEEKLLVKVSYCSLGGECSTVCSRYGHCG
jgi:hypothetical protein